MMNFLWCVIALQLQAMEGTLKSTFYIVQKYEPLSLAFLAIFALVLLLQFLSMLVREKKKKKQQQQTHTHNSGLNF
jgi:hypothetical protein